MKTTTCLILVLSFCLVLYCGNRQKADLVIKNGKIFTGSGTIPEAQAVAVLGDKILAVGTDREIERFIGSETKILDVQRRLAIPGLMDSHAHLSMGGNRLAMLDLTRLGSIEKIQEKLAVRAKELPEGTAIFGLGSFPSNMFPGLGWPTKEILDKAAPKHPVVVNRGGGHAVWVNSLALKLSGIDRKTRIPYGGEISKDPKTGEPTGILKEAAIRLLKVEMKSTTREDIERGLQHVLATALTGIQTLSNLEHTDLDDIEVFRQLNKEGKLNIRVNASLPLDGIDEYIAKGIQPVQGDNMVRVGFLKGFIDGSIGVRTALMFEPFSDEPGNTGRAQYGEEEFYALLEKADKHNFQIAIHAIGDKGINWVLNGFEKAQQKNGNRGLRHRVEHCTVVQLSDLKRFKQLGVIASMQPNITGDQAYREKRLGVERARRVDMWRSLLDNGAMICWGTDWPVSDINPMVNLNRLVTRYPEQKLTMAEAIKYYSYGSAYASFEENIKGTLERGKLADIVVLSKDLFTISPEEILTTEVVLKILGGKIIYQKNI